MKTFTTKNYPWTLNGLIKCMEDHRMDSEIICNYNNCAIVMVKNYNDSIILGANSDWCISQHACSWEQYVSKNNNIQLFYYNFNLKPENNLSLVGATYRMRDRVELVCCFTRENRPIQEKMKCSCDDVALQELILKPLYGSETTDIEILEGLNCFNTSASSSFEKHKDDMESVYVPTRLERTAWTSVWDDFNDTYYWDDDLYY